MDPGIIYYVEGRTSQLARWWKNPVEPRFTIDWPYNNKRRRGYTFMYYLLLLYYTTTTTTLGGLLMNIIMGDGYYRALKSSSAKNRAIFLYFFPLKNKAFLARQPDCPPALFPDDPAITTVDKRFSQPISRESKMCCIDGQIIYCLLV